MYGLFIVVRTGAVVVMVDTRVCVTMLTVVVTITVECVVGDEVRVTSTGMAVTVG